mmetsp:Transcript_34697/g.66617  ORF Transcript_34697/g.66617 Transcript_34697/m.66617 type:complete len:249 (-) Transcript_34697:3-749(-)
MMTGHAPSSSKLPMSSSTLVLNVSSMSHTSFVIACTLFSLRKVSHSSRYLKRPDIVSLHIASATSIGSDRTPKPGSLAKPKQKVYMSLKATGLFSSSRSALNCALSLSMLSQPMAFMPRIHSSRVKTHIVFAFIFHAMISTMMSDGSTPRSSQNFSVPLNPISSLSLSLYMSNHFPSFAESSCTTGPCAAPEKKASTAASRHQSKRLSMSMASRSLHPVKVMNCLALSFCARLREFILGCRCRCAGSD